MRTYLALSTADTIVGSSNMQQRIRHGRQIHLQCVLLYR